MTDLTYTRSAFPDRTCLEHLADLLDRRSETNTGECVDQAYEYADAARFIAEDFEQITATWIGTTAELEELRQFAATHGHPLPELVSMPHLSGQTRNVDNVIIPQTCSKERS
ncbi:hypothetical protein [Rhodococcus ruber]|uniref:hypothetical protein n=1 Tax=Rhodococcus ruber TaxID=1830 RepID=UPI001F1C7BB8|nr:hypothetical protein [Rhodococcus ruber]MCF8786166.1 hypothetical protein [Rhodococcus ruber]